MLKRLFALGVVAAIGTSLAGCYVEDHQPQPGGGGGTVIEHDKTIEHDHTTPDTTNKTNINVNPAPGTNSSTTTNHSTTTTTTP